MFRKVLVSVGVLAAVGLQISAVGCSSSSSGGKGGFSCDGESPCTGDPKLDADARAKQKAECEKALGGSCGGQYRLAGECALTVACKDNKTDSQGILSKCDSELKAYISCQQGGPDGGGTPDGGGGGDSSTGSDSSTGGDGGACVNQGQRCIGTGRGNCCAPLICVGTESKICAPG